MKKSLTCSSPYRNLLLAILGSFAAFGCVSKPEIGFKELEDGFRTIPDTVETSVYWFWISDNISREGVVKDLEAMKSVGINRVFIANIGLDETPYGQVEMFSDEWWEILRIALRTASALDIEIGIFNCSGWSQSGGPWVRPHQAMRYLSATDTLLVGPLAFSGKLAGLGSDFQDVRVLTFRAGKGHGESFLSHRPVIQTSPAIADAMNLVDGDAETTAVLPTGGETLIDIKFAGAYEVRSISIVPAKRRMHFDVTLEAEVEGGFRPLKSFRVDRSNTELHVGFEPFAPVVESLPVVSSSSYRLRIGNASAGTAIADIILSPAGKVARYHEKTLAKMHPTPLPLWDAYQWPRQDALDQARYAVNDNDVLDISEYMGPDGKLRWDVPEGQWVVMRTGMLPTGVTNMPASPESVGLEVDKMSEAHAASHFDAFLGEIYRRIPAEDRRTWKVAVMDSYEVGGQNWTDDFIAKFKTRYSYDPTPYIPSMFGHVVNSQDHSDRFLWDLRRFIADQVAHEYIAGFRKISNEHGLKLWLENYGHWGFPAEFLQYGGQADEIAGEFWSEGELGDIENRAASSAAHIYGKNKVYSESFTAAGNAFARYPAMFKQRGDRFFTEGVNSTLLNTSIQQPDDRPPGINALFGNEFNRLNTWYGDMAVFVDYLKRCNFMLQQGRYVADVAYFIGEDTPKMTGVQDPSLPKGYSFDYINAEVILTRMSVKDGLLVLPDGMRYRLMVLPRLETMTPELLAKISRLVHAGGVILGPPPMRSPSLANFGEADEIVAQLAADLWGRQGRSGPRVNRYGKGLVMDGLTMEEALGRLGVIPDFELPDADSILFIHREMTDGDIYFLSNQRTQSISIEPKFRVSGKVPELWDPVSGSIRELPDFSVGADGIRVPIVLEKYGSAFIVFRKRLGEEPHTATATNYLDPSQVIKHEAPWIVTFEGSSRGPVVPVVFERLSDWSTHPDTSIAYYAGSAVYRSSIRVSDIEPGSRLVLGLGDVVALAKVKVNGQPAGAVWTAPYQLDVTELLKVGDNDLEIKVVNTWPNRLIGDQRLPEGERPTRLSVNPYRAESQLHRAGLLGPVTLSEVASY